MSERTQLSVDYLHKNDLQPRLQWEHNGGYCGEVSMISAGLYYGQYLSQYDVREIASPGMKQNAKGSSGNYSAQLLLGENAAATAAALRLAYEQMEMNSDSEGFMAWVKNHVAQGHPVIIGVFNNVNMLRDEPLPGDNEYDHIVPVFGFGSRHPLTDQTYYPDDVILFSDNGLYTQPGNPLGYTTPPQGYIPQYQYFFPLDTDNGPYPNVYNFLLGREEANNLKGNIYSLLDLPTYQSDPPSKSNYGLAITGVMDPNHETLPVRVVTDPNREHPAIAHDSNDRPQSMTLTLTVTVSGLTPGIAYNLYRYEYTPADKQIDVPIRDFNSSENAHKATHVQSINISSGTTWSTTLQITSDLKIFFRAVKAQ